MNLFYPFFLSLCLFIHSTIYPNNLKNREFGKEAPQIFRSARAAVLIDTARARDEKSGAKPTTPKTDSSGCLGIALEETKHVELPTPVAYLENLYFNYWSHFIVFGENIQLEKIIKTIPNRYYRLMQIPPDQQIKSGMGVLRRPIHHFDKTTLILMEEQGHFLFHFFHLLEHLVGVWAFYGHEHAKDVKRIVLAPGAPDQTQPNWEGPNSINRHVLHALFPQAEIMTWNRFIQECGSDLVCLERTVISDRGITFSHPECCRINKHLGAALAFIDPKNLQSFADHVHSYAQTKQEKYLDTLRVTYVKRPPPRCLAEDIERSMIEKISALPNVQFKAVDFAQISFHEQIHIVGNTDMLIGVHGNGLSHILFLPSTACAIEIFPPGAHHLDYHVFADVRGIDYFGILYRENVFIDKERAYQIGAYGNPNAPIDALDIDLILSAIRSRIRPK